MKVFILVKDEWEDRTILGVYSSLEKAKIAMHPYLKEQRKPYPEFYIEEWKVDAKVIKRC